MKANIVKFIGKFKNLIPNGWTFYWDSCTKKYRQYSKGESYQKCRIYQKERDFQIDRLNSREAAMLVNLIEENKIEECKILLFSGKESYWIYSDIKEERLIPYKDPEFKTIQARLNGDDEWCDRYQLHYLHPPLIELLQDLLNKGWIKSEYNPKIS